MITKNIKSTDNDILNYYLAIINFFQDIFESDDIENYIQILQFLMQIRNNNDNSSNIEHIITYYLTKNIWNNFRNIIDVYNSIINNSNSIINNSNSINNCNMTDILSFFSNGINYELLLYSFCEDL